MLYFPAKMMLIGTAHFAMGVFLYYLRTTHQSPILNSDILVFLLPAFLAFGGYFWVAWCCTFPTHHVAVKLALATLISLSATAISCICIMTFAFNKYGT